LCKADVLNSLPASARSALPFSIEIFLEVKYRDDASLFLGGVPMITTDIISYISNDLVVFYLYL
jgi:predicted RND superfamily exporter protein